MRATKTELYVHLVWATWDRLPLIDGIIKDRLAAAIATKCRQLDAEPLAIGLVADHVHLLARIAPTIAISTLAKEVKGASSHLITHVVSPDSPLGGKDHMGRLQ